MSNIYVESGDAYLEERRLVVTVTDAGVGVDLTGVSLVFMVKDRRSDDDDEALIDKSTDDLEIEIASPQSGATLGVAYVGLDPADTADLAGRYYWELEGTDSIGATTLARGSFYVEADLVVSA